MVCLIWLFYRASPAGPRSVLATLPWGNVWVLVHTETAVSRLRQSLSIFEVGFVIRCGRPGSCVRPRHSSSNCVFYRLRGLEINISLVTVVCCCVECQSADCRFTPFGVIALMCMPIYGVADQLIAIQLSSSSSCCGAFAQGAVGLCRSLMSLAYVVFV